MSTGNFWDDLDAPRKGTAELRAYLKASVTIDDMFLDDEFIRLPSDLSFWNARYADALETYLKAKLEAERVRSQAHITLKESLSSSGVKFTQADLEARVMLEEDVQEAHLALVDADVDKSRLRGFVDAIIAKRDMIQSLGAKRRLEMQDPVVRQQESERRLNR